MAANDVVFARVPIQNGELMVKNTHASTALVPGQSVTVDALNLMSSTQPCVGVVPATADQKVFGVADENIAAGAVGRVIVPYTHLVPVTASGVITAGDSVEADTGALFKTSAGTKFCFGDALTTTASNGDQCLLAIPAQAKI